VSDSLRLSLRLRLSISPIEPISGLSWPNFLHIKAHSQGHSRYFLDSQFYHFDCTQFDSTQTKRAISAICLTFFLSPALGTGGLGGNRSGTESAKHKLDVVYNIQMHRGTFILWSMEQWKLSRHPARYQYCALRSIMHLDSRHVHHASWRSFDQDHPRWCEESLQAHCVKIEDNSSLDNRRRADDCWTRTFTISWEVWLPNLSYHQIWIMGLTCVVVICGKDLAKRWLSLKDMQPLLRQRLWAHNDISCWL